MATNLEKYQKDLDALIANGELIVFSLERECLPKEFDAGLKKQLGDDKWKPRWTPKTGN
jgi:hypothetical protein